MADWPTTLPPFPEAMSYQEQARSQTLRTEMDTGPAKVRRRFTAGVVNFSVQWLLDADQLDDLEAFFDATLGGGSLTFQAKHPRTGAVATLGFVEPYSVQPSSHSMFWAVGAKLERLP